jgi:thiamine kinase-like enzyme
MAEQNINPVRKDSSFVVPATEKESRFSNGVKSIVQHFHICGHLSEVKALARGHINDTYVLTAKKDNCRIRYILQRINHTVFKNPPLLMENIIRVTEHIRSRMQRVDPEQASRQLTVIASDNGMGFHKDDEGNFWRIYNFIEDAITFNIVQSADLAYEAARMFGWFQKMLIDLSGPALHETICDFHNTPKRLETFQQVLKEDTFNRAKSAKAEIDFLFANAILCDVLLNLQDKGEIALRITHNDTKLNNVMLDKTTKKGVCVIDLDTVMPGLSLYDFGDMVRTTTTSADEDERDLSKVFMNLSMFEAIVRGFAEQTRDFLTSTEKTHLAFAAKLITFEQFVRFLTDYLAGDIYYKIHREGHNLDRARTQAKLVQSIIEQEELMNEVVERILQEEKQ